MKFVKIYKNYKEFLDEQNYLFDNQRSIDFEKLGYDHNVNGVTQKFLDKHHITLEEYEQKYCIEENFYQGDGRRYHAIKGCFNCWECIECRYCEECIKCECCDDCTNCEECYGCTDCEKCTNCEECNYCNECEKCGGYDDKWDAEYYQSYRLENCKECYGCRDCENCIKCTCLFEEKNKKDEVGEY